MKRLSAYLLILSLLPVGALAQSKMLAKPKSGYVLDKATLLNAAAIQRINTLSKASEKDRQSPIYVVTIPSLESVRADDIEIYANELFDNWAIGTRAANKGILLVVSKGDRKARIALGAHWKYSMDDHCAEIMNRKIVPRFKSGDYHGGILVGVQGLAAMANMGQQSSKPYPLRSGGSPSHTPVGQAPSNHGHAHPPSGITETYYPENSYPMGMSPAGSINLSSFGMLCPVGCILPFGFIILVMLANAASGGRSKGYRDDDDSGWFSSNSGWSRRHDHHRHHHGGFGGSRSGSFGGGSSSSSSSGRSGGSGGGFTGGGGASGSW